MLHPPTPDSRAAFDLKAVQRREAISGYLAVLAAYAAAFGHHAVQYPCELAAADGLVPLSWPRHVYDWTHWAQLDGPILAWLAALAIAVTLVWRRGTSRLVPTRTAAVAGAVVLAVPGLWATAHTAAFSTNDAVWGRIVQTCGTVALIGAWAAARRAPGRDELGLPRHQMRDIKNLYDSTRWSLLGCGLSALISALIVPLHGVVPDPWRVWLLVSVTNAVAEETVCTAWLYARLRRAWPPHVGDLCVRGSDAYTDPLLPG